MGVNMRNLLNFAYDCIEGFIISRKRKGEIKKFKDERRIAICKEGRLTEAEKRLVDEFYLENYGKKIPYVWHENYKAHSGSFDEKYFPEMLYIPEFELFMNFNSSYAKAFGDKNVLPLLAQSAKIKTPKKLMSVVSGLFTDAEHNRLSYEQALDLFSNIGKAFVKPSVGSSSGNGCYCVEMVDGTDLISGKTAKEIFDSFGSDMVVQEIIRCHESLSRIHPESVNTFRIITYRWKDEILHMPAILRIGQGKSFLDNAHAGGMFIAVDDDGKLHKTAITEFNVKFDIHPDTGYVFADGYIPNFVTVIEAAKKMHSAIPQLGAVNWDFTIDESGCPLLIEANTQCGSIWLTQMAHGKGGFGDKTAEVLRWLNDMKKIPKSKRYNHRFGK